MVTLSEAAESRHDERRRGRSIVCSVCVWVCVCLITSRGNSCSEYGPKVCVCVCGGSGVGVRYVIWGGVLGQEIQVKYVGLWKYGGSVALWDAP